MQDHPDSSVADVAELVGLSHTPCWRRMKRLQDTGVVQGRFVLLNPRALGLTVNVFAAVTLKQHDEETLTALEAVVRTHDEIVECFSVGGSSDYLMRIVVESVEAYETFLKKVLLHLPGMGAVNSNFALGCVKLTNKLPLRSAGLTPLTT